MAVSLGYEIIISPVARPMICINAACDRRQKFLRLSAAQSLTAALGPEQFYAWN